MLRTTFACTFTCACLCLAGCAGAPAPMPMNAGSTPTGDAANTRHSAATPGLMQITPANVAQLQLAWHFATGAARGQEGAPLVVGDLLVLHTPFPNRVFALSLADHQVRWSYAPQQAANVASLMCCDVVSRGLAHGVGKSGRGRIFLQQADGTLVALDARTGQRLWQVQNSDPSLGATASNAPQVFDRYVVTGVAGGEYGVRGHLTAYDADTGALAWRGWSTGPDADMLIDPEQTMTWRDGRMVPVGRDSSLQSWVGDQWKLGGGTAWGWTAYDPALRLVYYGTGNPGPWNALQRPGDNRWTNALWARDIDTGRVRWVYQMTPHDEWDYDGVNETILFDGPAPMRFENGSHSALPASNTRRLLEHFDRNGFAYTLDRATGELLDAQPFDASVNWATRIDLHSGRPVVDPAFSPGQHGEDVTTEGICPPAIGSKNQAPAAYDPALNLFFVPANHLCMDIEPFHVDYTAGQPYIGASITIHPVPGSEESLGRFIAWDAVAGRIAWSRPEPAPVWSGALSTATGLVFYGTLDARLKALDAKTGTDLWVSPPLPSGVVGNVTTWAFEGRQYIGVLTGIGGLANDPEGIGGLRAKTAGAAASQPAAQPQGPASKGEFVVFALPQR